MDSLTKVPETSPFHSLVLFRREEGVPGIAYSLVLSMCCETRGRRTVDYTETAAGVYH